MDTTDLEKNALNSFKTKFTKEIHLAYMLKIYERLLD